MHAAIVITILADYINDLLQPANFFPFYLPFA